MALSRAETGLESWLRRPFFLRKSNPYRSGFRSRFERLACGGEFCEQYYRF